MNKISEELRESIAEDLRHGLSLCETARRSGVNRSTVTRIAKEIPAEVGMDKVAKNIPEEILHDWDETRKKILRIAGLC